VNADRQSSKANPILCELQVAALTAKARSQPEVASETITVVLANEAMMEQSQFG
jgi:hypothetical protein